MQRKVSQSFRFPFISNVTEGQNFKVTFEETIYMANFIVVRFSVHQACTIVGQNIFVFYRKWPQMWPEKEQSKVSNRSKLSTNWIKAWLSSSREHWSVGGDSSFTRRQMFFVERNEYEMKPGSGKTVDHSERWTKEDLLCINQCRSVANRFLFEIFDGKLIPGVNVFYSW